MCRGPQWCMIERMNAERSSPIAVDTAGWRVLTGHQQPPIYNHYRDHAELVDELANGDDGDYVFIGVGRSRDDWPTLIISQTYTPSWSAPGVLVVPETSRVFVGAGTRLLCYRSDEGQWSRQWQDEAEVSFSSWRRHDDIVVMSAELELAVWTTAGDKLWTTFVEPPWTYGVHEGTVRLDVMGEITEFPLRAGR